MGWTERAAVDGGTPLTNRPRTNPGSAGPTPNDWPRTVAASPQRVCLKAQGEDAEGSTYMADNDGDSDEARVLRPLQAAACTYRIAFGPRAGQKVLTVQGAMPRETDFEQPLCADIDGFSLHAAVRCGADDRQALEQLCRYITRPALANERVQTNAAGQVVLKLKTAWRNGTTHLVMSPLEFMQRLAALVPRPRLHLIRLVSA